MIKYVIKLKVISGQARFSQRIREYHIVGAFVIGPRLQMEELIRDAFPNIIGGVTTALILAVVPGIGQLFSKKNLPTYYHYPCSHSGNRK